MIITVTYEKRDTSSVTFWDEPHETIEDARDAAETTVDDGEADEARFDGPEGSEYYTSSGWMVW